VTSAEPLATEDAFFRALEQGDVARLESLLTDDFLIVDVMRGGTAGRAEFLGALSGGGLTFQQVEVVERTVREYGGAAVVVGRTAMSGAFAGQPFTAASRYTHVFVQAGGAGWQLASAQGTQIIE
jgi:ketosteroid isomerase-like protein